MASKKKISKKKSKKKTAKKKVVKKKTTPKKKSKKKSKASDDKNNYVNITTLNGEAPNGRPRKIKSPKEMDKLINEYVMLQAEKKLPLLLTGMILYLGLSSRESFDEYKSYEGFSDSVKRGKLLIEVGYEFRLHGTTPTGSIFALKNFGWFDKTPEGGNDEPPETITPIFNVAPAKANVRVTKGKKQ